MSILARAFSDLPALIQAPMAGVQGNVLAAAVANAGGLGSLPAAMLGPEALRHELAALRAATDQPYNVNFFCHAPPPPDPAREAAWRARLAPYFAELGLAPPPVTEGASREPFGAASAAVLEEFRPAVVSFHFGLPAPALLARVRALGAIILSSATTLAEALWLEARGVDAVIAQGVEAGGHRGLFLGQDLATQRPTLELVREVAASVRVPVIAAGGIGSAAGVAAAIAAGAAGVQVGTAYLCCSEAATSVVHRAALASPMSRETVLTNLFTGRPARAIVNRLVRELGALRDDVPAFPRAAAALAPLRAAGESRGSADFSPLWCGAGASPCRAVPAAELTRELRAGLQA